MKTCHTCLLKKTINNFYIHKFNLDGYSGSCKSCDKQKVIDRYRTKKGLITHIYSNQKRASIKRKHPLPSYSKKELCSWVFSQSNFDIVYRDWVDSGYKKDLIPSVDRLDDYKPYSLKNIRLTTWNVNRRKDFSNTKNGVNRKRLTPVFRYNLDGERIKFYYSIAQAARENKIHGTGISKVCRRKGMTSGGFKWEYAN